MQITLDYVHEHAQTNILEQNYSRVFIKNWRPKAIQHPSRLCRHVFKYVCEGTEATERERRWK